MTKKELNLICETVDSLIDNWEDLPPQCLIDINARADALLWLLSATNNKDVVKPQVYVELDKINEFLYGSDEAEGNET